MIVEEIKQGYKKWKKEQTISPFDWYLDHTKTLLAPSGEIYDEENSKYADKIWDIYVTITKCAMILENPFEQWEFFCLLW